MSDFDFDGVGISLSIEKKKDRVFLKGYSALSLLNDRRQKG